MSDVSKPDYDLVDLLLELEIVKEEIPKNNDFDVINQISYEQLNDQCDIILERIKKRHNVQKSN